MSMLWADKYRPKDLSSLDYHKEQSVNLKNLTKDGDFPHLLVYGPLGAGKKTRIMCLLKELYGPGIERLKMEMMSFTTPSNKKLEIMTLNSNYHIEVNPSDVGIYDRVVIMDIIKNVAQSQQLNVNAQREFKVIVLTDVDDLTKDAQHALRRTMEKYIANCRIILCATSISRVIPAIRSRCLCIRVPAPPEETIIHILQNTCKKEDLNLPTELAKRIALVSNRNLRRALLICEACKVEQYPFTPDQKVTEPDWQVFIKKTATKILQVQNIDTLAKVRENLYELLSNAIPSDIIFKTLLEELLKKCDFSIKARVVEEAAIHEHRMVQGNKAIFHLESFVAKFMYIYQSMMQEMIGDF
ncbi:replication factor C subunit 3 [Diorhabda sublineata]|uniref:replication factor C subunit 3 n=1 Tax=Diorhabda sublineata TaxID=1163346 RepID=UPI0024E069FF|nr:replication factor C subunit 3 [Diorhabda sublineata]